MHHFQKAAVAAVVGLAVPSLLTTTSCSRDVFDPDEYDSIVKFLSPVDSVDKRHEWNLTQQHTYTFNIGEGTGAERLQLYTEDPLNSSNARLMARTYVNGSSPITLTLPVPVLQETIFAALISSDGQSSVTSFSVNETNISFSQPLSESQRINTQLKPQTFTYIFEGSCPEPDDYDYNDVVLRLSQERTGRQQIALTVTLAAVGADCQLAGAIHLNGISYNSIDSVTVSDGSSFNEGLPKSSRIFFDEKTNLLMKSREGEAVIELFQDAHWAMGFNLGLDYGYFTRKKYNVTSSSTKEAQIKSVRTKTYNIFFKNEKGLDNFTFDTLDPFTVNTYNGSFWEIHLYKFRQAQTMYSYTLPGTKSLPWALSIPTHNFQYPLEGQNIGFKKKGQTFGAYMKEGHSFGEWCEDCTRTLDWYLYPEATLVY